MPTNPKSRAGDSLPSPWKEFLLEFDSILPEPLELHCIGGFVVCYFYGLPRPTGDIDYYSAVPATRLLDDHLHDVPDPVFALLEETATTSPNPLTVILERDGDFPSMPALLSQMRQARQAVARGRARKLTATVLV